MSLEKFFQRDSRSRPMIPLLLSPCPLERVGLDAAYGEWLCWATTASPGCDGSSRSVTAASASSSVYSTERIHAIQVIVG